MDDTEARKRWMAVLARAGSDAIDARLAAAAPLPAHTRLRGPETGLTMVRGRMGGAGAPFNVGEMTVTRCTVRNAAGQVGHAVVAGRDARHAELAAALDAALQAGGPWHATVIDPLAAAQHAARTQAGREAAATKVEFFTMATMRG